MYGEIADVKMVSDPATGKFRGYAFVQFATEEDLKAAYKDADAKKINGRRCVVDVERGRTVEGWKPRRLGGGLGRTRVGPAARNQQYSGRDPKGFDAVGKQRGIGPAAARDRSLSPPGGRHQRSQRDRESRDSRRDDRSSYRREEYRR